MLLSIIIPIYNTEKFISECVNSILPFIDKTNIEIILVNDGSTDNSKLLCEEYVINNSNVKLINQKNGGLACARNTGLQNASGEYLLFLDSDDYYLNEFITINKLLNTALEKNLDILCFNYTRNKTHTPERKYNADYDDNVKRLVNNNIYISSACIKLIKRQILLDNNIFFISGTLSEDILFSAKILNIKNIKIAFLNKVLYFYRVREGSITKSITTKHILDLLNIIDELATYKNELVLSYTSFQYATLLINICLTKEKLNQDILETVYKYSYLLKYNKSKTVKIINFCKNIIGVKLTSKLLATAFKIKGN